MENQTVGRLLKVLFQFESVNMPPPFSHQYRIELDLKNESPHLSLDLKYTDREELTEDEILDEGFTLNDDFSWKGDLPAVWKKSVLEKINESNFISKAKKSTEHLPFLVISLFHAGSDVQELIPAEEKTWEPFLQEIIQASFEMAGKEKSLFIRYLSVKNNKTTSKELKLSFAHRMIIITIDKGEGTPIEKVLSWQAGQKLMKNVYILDYPENEGSLKTPGTDGHFIDIGDGNWYNLDTEVESPTNRKDLVSELKNILESY
jgi:hypothetical protein